MFLLLDMNNLFLIKEEVATYEEIGHQNNSSFPVPLHGVR